MLRGRLREASNGRRSQRAKHEIALHDNRRHYVVDRGDRSHGRHRIDDNRGGEDRRPSYGASKRYRSERQARNGYRPRDNQPRERKSSAGREKDGKGKGSPCEMHSYSGSGRPAKHEIRPRPIKRSRQRSVRKHTMLTTSITLRVTPEASASTARRWRATNPAKGTVVARITPTTKTILPSPSRPRLASEPSAMYRGDE